MVERHQDDPIGSFLANHSTFSNEGRLRMLEISVFDSGPGLVRRYKHLATLEDVTAEEEKESVLECFTKHRTSSGAKHRGIGLDAAIRALTAVGGFMRLRTGRLCLYRDFGKCPLSAGTALQLKSWPGEAAWEEAVGTVYTFIVPVPGDEAAR